MKKQSTSLFFSLRVLVGLVVVLAGVFLALLAFGAFSNAFAQAKAAKPASNIAQGLRHKASPQVVDGNFWASTGGPQGGDVAALVTNANGYIFAGTQGGGVFRSLDNGATWTSVNSGLTTTDVHALASNSDLSLGVPFSSRDKDYV